MLVRNSCKRFPLMKLDHLDRLFILAVNSLKTRLSSIRVAVRKLCCFNCRWHVPFILCSVTCKGTPILKACCFPFARHNSSNFDFACYLFLKEVGNSLYMCVRRRYSVGGTDGVSFSYMRWRADCVCLTQVMVNRGSRSPWRTLTGWIRPTGRTASTFLSATGSPSTAPSRTSAIRSESCACVCVCGCVCLFVQGGRVGWSFRWG